MIFPSHIIFLSLYSVEADLPMNSVHTEQCSAYGVVSLLWVGYIKAGESLGRSDWTELHRGKIHQ